jgi:hypothetical protein
MLKQAKHLMAVAACAGLAAAAVTTYSPSAEACGGLFCNQSQPVNQAAERIIFAKNPDNTVDAVVQIMYEGPSEKFAWVLPVPGSPEVDVSSNQALDRLQQATNPIYRLQTRVEGQCANGGARFGGVSDSANGAPEGGNNGGGSGGVTVVDSGNVGPYNHTTISVDPSTPNPEEAALEWLDTNGYDISALAPDLIRDYLEDGMNLLAVKLQKDTESGDIRPIRIKYDAELPMIPIKLTAVAANDDMGVLVWVLGQERAIPSNYKSLKLNQAAIDWFNPNNNYNDVVSMAANEAQGQGFVTEYADEVAEPVTGTFQQQFDLTNLVFQDFEQQQWDSIESQDWTDREGDLLRQTARYSQFDGYQRVIDDHVPLPQDTTAEEFSQCPSCYDITRESDIAAFDPATFISQMDELVIKPMSETQELVNSLPYITRLYTTMSAAEMTLDPVFDFNSDLGDESNFHQAEQVIECSRDYTQNEAPWRVELPQGDTVYGVGQNWPVDAEDGDMPATRLIVQDEPMGSGQVVTDNSAEINDAIQRSNQRVSDEVSGGLACSATGNSAVDLSLALVMAGFGLVAVRRRRS